MLLLLAVLGTLATLKPGRVLLSNVAAAGIAGNLAQVVKHVSPIEGVTDIAWRRFVRMMEGRDPREVSPSLHLGLYNIGYHRLRELGLATDVKQVPKGERRVWVGKLKPPLTLGVFLASPTLQYGVFVKDVIDRLPLIAPFVGREIEGRRASLSGLLAAVKLAGRKGFLSWVESETERARHPKTTRAFCLINDVF